MDKDEARIKIVQGKTFINLTNFSTPFKIAYKRANPSLGYVYGDKFSEGQLTESLFKIDQQIYFTTSSARLGVSGPTMDPQSEMSAEFEFEKNKERVFTGKFKKDGTRHKTSGRSPKNWVQETSFSKKQVASARNASGAGSAGAGIVDLINFSMETYINSSISNDLWKLNDQLNGVKEFENGQFITKKSVLDNALEDVNLARSNGLIDSKYVNNISALSQIMNVVLFGGDGTESLDILHLGRSVIENYSSQDAKNRLILTELNEQLRAPKISEYENFQND